MEKFLLKLSGLLTIKSIVTLILTFVFAVLALRGDISAQEYITIFSVVIAFYFGTQAQKIADTFSKDAGVR